MALDIDELMRIVPGLLRDVLLRDGLSAQEVEEAIDSATLQDIRAFEVEYGVSLSQDVVDWLLVTNGVNCGPDGLNGVSGPMMLGTLIAFQDHPAWRTRNWFPVARDGFGNFYVSYPIEGYDRRRPVCFIDMIKDPYRPNYLVASSVWHFVYFLLREELGDERWPFDREYVLGQDPGIELFSEVPMPWHSD